MKIFFFIFTFLFWNVSVKAESKFCHQFLNLQMISHSEISTTQRFISYLIYLFDHQVVDLNAIETLVKELKTHEKILTNPIAHKNNSGSLIFSQSGDEIHYKNLAIYLEQDDLNINEILHWAEGLVRSAQRVKQEKDHVNKETMYPFIKMKFHPVSHGEFWMGEEGKKVHVILTHDIEVMSTPVTQWMWAMEMKNNPAHFKTGQNSIKISIQGEEVELQPDHPVENITWYSAAMFANQLSKKHNLPDAYDFSGVQFKPGTKVEDGTLDIISGEVKINGTSIYETSGFRLATEAEQEYLRTDRGRSATGYFTDVTTENLTEYGWFAKNSENRTHPVAEKKALIIDGHDFHDLIANVREWRSDYYAIVLKGEENPTGPAVGDPYVLNGRVSGGGAYYFQAKGLLSGNRFHSEPKCRVGDVGFRLVRTVK